LVKLDPEYKKSGSFSANYGDPGTIPASATHLQLWIGNVKVTTTSGDRYLGSPTTVLSPSGMENFFGYYGYVVDTDL
jgi:hypothetical protein